MGKTHFPRWRVLSSPGQHTQQEQTQEQTEVELLDSIGIAYVEDSSGDAESNRGSSEEVEEDRGPVDSTSEQQCAADCGRLLIPVEMATDSVKSSSDQEGPTIPGIISFSSGDETEQRNCSHPSSIADVKNKEPEKKETTEENVENREPEEENYTVEEAVIDESQGRSFLDLLMCNMGESLSLGARPVEDVEGEADEDNQDEEVPCQGEQVLYQCEEVPYQGKEVPYQRDGKSDASSEEPGSDATEEINNVNFSTLADFDLPKEGNLAQGSDKSDEDNQGDEVLFRGEEVPYQREQVLYEGEEVTYQGEEVTYQDDRKSDAYSEEPGSVDATENNVNYNALIDLDLPNEGSLAQGSDKSDEDNQGEEVPFQREKVPYQGEQVLYQGGEVPCQGDGKSDGCSAEPGSDATERNCNVDCSALIDLDLPKEGSLAEVSGKLGGDNQGQEVPCPSEQVPCQGKDVPYQGDEKSDACSEDPGSVATEKMGNVNYSALTDLHSFKEGSLAQGSDKLRLSNDKKRNASAVISRRSRSDSALDAHLGRRLSESAVETSFLEEELTKRISAETPHSSKQDEPDSIFGSGSASSASSAKGRDDKSGTKKKTKRFFSFLRKGGKKNELATSDPAIAEWQAKWQKYPPVVRVVQTSGDSVVNIVQASGDSLSDPSDGSTTLDGTEPPDEATLVEPCAFDFYDEMDMIRQMKCEPLYLYRTSSLESTQSTRAHLAVYEFGEMVKNPPLAVSSVKSGIDFVGRQLSAVLEEGAPSEDMFEGVRSTLSGLDGDEEELNLSGHDDNDETRYYNLELALKDLQCNVDAGCVLASCMAPTDAVSIDEEKDEGIVCRKARN